MLLKNKMAYWLIKSDPETYSFDNLKVDSKTIWDGVRNYQARNNLDLMKKGETLLFYHSNIDMAIVGTVKVSKEAFPDPSTDDIRWKAIEIKFDKQFKKPITLAEIKQNPSLQNMPLIRHTRLSVMPISEDEFNKIIELTK